ncbi:MAG: glycosyltransferase family 2 protein [Chthoniobacterales bacterium]|nr:glycosyltransferase family 2 protein [Chthoniobacterales bacterium]
MTVSLFMPTLNEAKGLRIVLPKIDRSLFCQILLADGQSQDDTLDYAISEGLEVYVQKKKGIRFAYIEAWPLLRGDYIITFSPDGNCPPEDLPRLIQKAKEGYDMVIASRYLPPAKSEDDGLLTGFGNWFFTRTINFLHGAHYADAMTIYRCYRRQLFYELELDHEEAYLLPELLFFTRIGIEPLLSVRAARAGCKIAEIPSIEPKRIAGDPKVQVFRWGAAYYTQFFLELGWVPPHIRRKSKLE